MAAPWSDKGDKPTIIGADQFMILDSEDGNLSTKNKLITMDVLTAALSLTDGSIFVGNTNDVAVNIPVGLETKIDCLVATTENITLANSQTIDGVAVVNDNRVLVKNQTDATENGIYVVEDASSWNRSSDADEDSEVNNGMCVFITSGTINVNTTFILSTADDITLGTTELTFGEFNFADIAHLNSAQTFTETNTFTNTIEYSDGSTQIQAAHATDIYGSLTTVISTGVTFTPDAANTSPSGLSFKNDGTIMFIADTDNTLYAYDLPTAWDISSASSSVTATITAATNFLQGIYFRPDGLRFYVVDGSGVDLIRESSLTTAWDISTSGFTGKTFGVATQDTDPTGVSFSAKGDKMYVIGLQNDNVNEYTLSIPWDLDTAVISFVFPTASFDNIPRDITFSPDGKKFYIVGQQNNSIKDYVMDVAWDLSTASSVGNSVDLINNENRMGLFVSPLSHKIFSTGGLTGDVYEFDMGIQTNEGSIVAGGRIQGNQGADVASADAITLGNGNTFVITGTTTINHMINTDWQSGSKVTLLFPVTAGITITSSATGAVSPEADFFLNADADFVITAGASLTLVYVSSSNLWTEICRSEGEVAEVEEATTWITKVKDWRK